jgi:hypothetical protein
MNGHRNDLFAINILNSHNLLFLHIWRLEAHVLKIGFEIFIQNQPVNNTDEIGGSFLFYLCQVHYNKLDRSVVPREKSQVKASVEDDRAAIRIIFQIIMFRNC